MSTVPTRSVPPPQVPTQLVAAARIRTLEEERAAAQQDLPRALLAYELAAQQERALGERDTIVENYQSAYRTHRALRAPLLALARLYSSPLSAHHLTRVLAALHKGATQPEVKAAFLVEEARIHLDVHGDGERAEKLLQAALECDPNYQEAALMLEHYWAGHGQLAQANAAVERRAAQVSDPALRGTLLLEVAEHQQQAGRLDEARALLLEASKLGHGKYAALQRLYYLALRTGDVTTQRDALLRQARLTSAFAREGDDTVEDDNAPLGRFLVPAAAADEAAVLYRELSHLLASAPFDASLDEVGALQAALNHRQDPLLWQEYTLTCLRHGAYEQVAFGAQHLSEQTPPGPAQAPFLYYQARAAAALKKTDEALSLYRRAVEYEPRSPSLISAFESQLWESGELGALCAYLQTRAEQDEDDRGRLWEKAAYLALRHLQDRDLASELVGKLKDGGPTFWLNGQRLLYAEAEHQDRSPRAAGTRNLLFEQQLSRQEHAYLRRVEYAQLRDEALSAGTPLSEGLHTFLISQLSHESTADWLPHAARVVAAQHNDFELLAKSHERLSSAELPSAARAAHLCAAARAHIRRGDTGAAEPLLRAALELQPDNPYAVALLQPVLVKQGQVQHALELLRDNARHQADRQQAVRRLIEAGITAEHVDDMATAADRYREANACMPNAAAAYALLSLSERVHSRPMLREALHLLDTQGLWPVAALDLCEQWDADNEFDKGDYHARRALNYPELRLPAALRLWTFGATPAAREAGMSALRARQDNSPFSLESHSLSTATDHSPERKFRRASAALSTVLQPHAHDKTTTKRADAYLELARLVESPEHHAAFTLQASRLLQLIPAQESHNDALVRALSLRVAAPEVTETAIALDEAVTASDDPKLRVLALSGRVKPYETSAPLSLRLAIAQEQLACGQADAALSSARTLLREHEEDVASLELLREAAFLCDCHSELAYANELLAQLTGPAQAAALLLEAAACHGDHLGSPADAERCLRRCLEVEPSHGPAFERLHDLLLEQENARSLQALVSQRLDLELESSERLELLMESAVLLHGLGECKASDRVVDQVLSMHPRHPGALELRVRVQLDLSEPNAAVAALSDLAQADISQNDRRRARLLAADLLTAAPLHAPLAAIEQLRHLQHSGIATPEVHRRLGELSLAVGLNGDAVAAYRAAAEASTGAERAQFYLLSAQVRESRLGDADAALADYQAALHTVPTLRAAHDGIQRLMTDAERRQNEASRFLNQIHVRLGAQPLDRELLRGMRSGAKASGLEFAEYAALDVMHALGQCDQSELAARAALIEAQAHRRKQPLDSEALRLLRKERDGGIGREIAKVCSQLLHDLAKGGPDTYGVSRKDRIKHGPLHSAISAELNACGLELRHLYQGGDNGALQIIATSKHPLVDCLVHTDSDAQQLSATQRYIMGRAAIAMQQEVFALFELPSDQRRGALIATARAAELPLSPLVPGQGSEDLSRRLLRHLSRKQRKQLQAAVTPHGQLWPALDFYLRAAQLTLIRAGLLHCGELHIALRSALLGRDRALEFDETVPIETANSGNGQSPAERTAELAMSETGLELIRYWTSTRALALHGERRRDLAREDVR